MKTAHTSLNLGLYHVPLDEFGMKSLSERSWTAFDNDTRSFQGFDLGFGSSLASADNGT
jgi:hypothetical protein